MQIFIFKIYQQIFMVNPHQDGAPVIILEGLLHDKFSLPLLQGLKNSEKCCLKILLPKFYNQKYLYQKIYRQMPNVGIANFF
jgi:hypothetical protein